MHYFLLLDNVGVPLGILMQYNKFHKALFSILKQRTTSSCPLKKKKKEEKKNISKWMTKKKHQMLML